MKAKDLMVSFQEYLKPDNTLKEAAKVLRTAITKAMLDENNGGRK